MDRFRRRFGDSVALLHSKMPAGARYDEWRRLRSGEARICVGPRSAIFAPVVDPGLIVIDEEHDSSYKQEGDPRYDAREVARRRASEAGAVLLCGTATPRPESWHELERLELPCRVDGRPLPPVEIVDMRGGDPRAPASAHAGGVRGGGGARWQGDPVDQPPRLVDPPHLPFLRPRLGVPELRRLADPPSRRGAPLSSLRAR